MSKSLREAAEASCIVKQMPVESCLSENKGVRKHSVSLFVKFEDMEIPTEYLIDMEGDSPQDSMVADFVEAAISQSLAEEERQEPTRWLIHGHGFEHVQKHKPVGDEARDLQENELVATPLYTHPQRKLTDEESNNEQ